MGWLKKKKKVDLDELEASVEAMEKEIKLRNKEKELKSKKKKLDHPLLHKLAEGSHKITTPPKPRATSKRKSKPRKTTGQSGVVVNVYSGGPPGSRPPGDHAKEELKNVTVGEHHGENEYARGRKETFEMLGSGIMGSRKKKKDEPPWW